MKLTTLALTAVLVAAASFARAQEEDGSARPRRIAGNDGLRTRGLSHHGKIRHARPETEQLPGRHQISLAATAKSSPSPAKSAPPPAAMPAKKSTPEATIREIEDKWEASIMPHDPSVAQAYLADDFRGVSSKGKVMSKSEPAG